MKMNVTHKPVMYQSKEAQRTLDPKFMTPYHKQAQWAEFTELKKVIGEIRNKRKRSLRVFDIGIGTARIPACLSTVATWDKIAKYIGIDISPFCVSQSKRIAKLRGIADKVEVVLFDATHLSAGYTGFLRNGKYDLVICTYFTAGDFQPDEIKLQTKENGSIVDYDVDVLKPNKNFIAVFKGAYELLHEGGKIVIGSVYYDNDLARKIQEDFYRRCKMTVITSSKDPFAATKEGFWSERFDQDKIYSYFPWVPKNKIELIPLDDYNFAFMVVIHK
jgi:SAM-dependent methyltransferase